MPCKIRIKQLNWRSLFLAAVLAWLLSPGLAPADPGPAAKSSILLPACEFDRGNVLAIPSGSYADAEPVVVNGGVAPNVMEYDFELPVAAVYALHARYAAQEPRPVDLYLDGVKAAQGFRSVTGSWQSSSARWEKIGDLEIAKGPHTLKLQCPGPCIPHIVALRLDSSEPFPAGWKLARPKARKLADLPLGQLAGYDNGKDGYEAFVREDGTVNVPDEYNPIIRFKRYPPPVPAAHRLLEYGLMDPAKYRLESAIAESNRDEAGGWEAAISVETRPGRKETAVLPLSEKELRKLIERALELIADFRAGGKPDLLEADRAQAAKLLSELDALLAAPEGEGKGRRFYELYREAFRLKHRIALANPLLDFGKLVFAKRQTYDTSHIYTTYFDGSHRFGGNLYVLEEPRPDARPRRLVEALGDQGIYRDPDVSWDGTRILFSWKPPKAEAPYQIYEIGADGGGLRQLTNSDYDDLDPAYLPDGRIVFVSTRPHRVVLCHNAFTVSVLHVMNADGSGIQCISANTVNEFTPSVAADGTLLYTRWEYVDKNVGNNQSLWAARPDGTMARHIAGAHWGPITFWEPRQVPESRLIVCTLAPHMPIASGPIALVDPLDACRSPARYTSLTPELPPPHHAGWHRNDAGYYTDPWPLSEKCFIVSYNWSADPEDPRGYGLYLLDRRGNRDLLYRDPETSCFEAMSLSPRPRPPALPAAAEPAGPTVVQPVHEEEGTFIVLDIYQGLKGVERGAVKWLRVIEEIPKPVSANCQGYGLQHPAISRDGNFAVKQLLGEVPVEADGSACFRAPAGKALYFAALDENYMEVQRMRSFVHIASGQTVTCAGCHEERREAPPNQPVLALRRPASEIAPPPGGAHAPDFYYDVQPVLDRRCGSCHSGERIEGGVDLSGDFTNLFNVAYETLTSKWVSYVNIYSSATLALRPPKYYGSHASKLMKTILGEHKKYLELPREDLRAIASWIDLNAPYYGTYQFLRPGTVGGRELVAGPARAKLDEVYGRRCASCHQGDGGRARQARFPGLERSPALRAPLAKAAGGAGRCGEGVFASPADPDYQAMRAALESLREELKTHPRDDMLARRPPIADPKAPYRYR